MGFLSGAFSSESSTRTDTTSQNAGQSEIGGAAYSVNLSGGGKNSRTSVTLTDQGAVTAGIDAAKYGLDNALDFANTTSARSTEAQLDVIKAALDATQSAFSDAIHFTQAGLDNLSSNQASALGSVTALAKQTSASESDRISKLAGFALLAIAALVILPKVFGK